MTDVRDSLAAEKAHASRLHRGCVAEGKKTQQLLAERWEVRWAANRQLTEIGGSCLGLQPKLVVVLSKLREQRSLAEEVAEELMLIKANAALQAVMWELTGKEVYFQVSDITTAQKRLTTKSDELSQLVAKQENLGDEARRRKS